MDDIPLDRALVVARSVPMAQRRKWDVKTFNHATFRHDGMKDFSLFGEDLDVFEASCSGT